jgi:hypothetical protein
MKNRMSIGFFFIQAGAFYYTIFQQSAEGFGGCGSRPNGGQKRFGGRRD